MPTSTNECTYVRVRTYTKAKGDEKCAYESNQLMPQLLLVLCKAVLQLDANSLTEKFHAHWPFFAIES